MQLAECCSARAALEAEGKRHAEALGRAWQPCSDVRPVNLLHTYKCQKQQLSKYSVVIASKAGKAFEASRGLGPNGLQVQLYLLLFRF